MVLGCLIVVIAKGPAYVADADAPLSRPLSLQLSRRFAIITRRHFALTIPAAALALLATRAASAQAAKLEETDAMAVSLGYRSDASKVDAKKFPAFAGGRNCANSQLYQGRAGEAWGGPAARLAASS